MQSAKHFRTTCGELVILNADGVFYYLHQGELKPIPGFGPPKDLEKGSVVNRILAIALERGAIPDIAAMEKTRGRIRVYLTRRNYSVDLEDAYHDLFVRKPYDQHKAPQVVDYREQEKKLVRVHQVIFTFEQSDSDELLTCAQIREYVAEAIQKNAGAKNIRAVRVQVTRKPQLETRGDIADFLLGSK